MSGNATNISASVTYTPVVSYEGIVTGQEPTFQVRFYSIPAQAWCEFNFSPGYSSGGMVFVRSPQRKTIKLHTDREKFKVGKVACRFGAGLFRTNVFVIDGIEVIPTRIS